MSKRIALPIIAISLLCLGWGLWLVRDLGLDRTGWIDGVPCAVPCWMQITPGQTSLSDARQTLERGTLGILRDVAQYGDNELIVRDLEGKTISIWAGGSPMLVRSIGFVPDGSITLQQVIDSFGEPTHVVAFAFPGTTVECTAYGFTLVFLDHGFELVWGETGNCIRPQNISAQSYEFDYVSFFEPSLEAYRAISSRAWGNMLKPFDGTFDFEHYCVGEGCG